MINEMLFRLGASHGANTDSAPAQDLEAEAALAGCSYSEEDDNQDREAGGRGPGAAQSA
jgi:hypothetical protein